MKHISYPKIKQFRNIVTELKHQITFQGVDGEGNAIYDHSIPMPVLKMKGTVKLHGTNAAVCWNNIDGLYAQSRSNIITSEKDNAGFAFFAESRYKIFMNLIMDILEEEKLDANQVTISIYGEWAGKGIQKGVAISEIDKAFFVFGVKISLKDGNNESPAYWVPSYYLSSVENRIFNIEQYKTYEIDLDMSMPQLVQNQLGEITEEVEKECPVAKAFGHSGIGEGIVWSVECGDDIHRFKVKGEKHSVSKVKKLASIDTEKLANIQEFVEYSVTQNRFEQAVREVIGINEIENKYMGEVIRWVVKDIMAEELDVLAENGLEPKDCNKYISTKVREMFFATQKAVRL